MSGEGQQAKVKAASALEDADQDASAERQSVLSAAFVLIADGRGDPMNLPDLLSESGIAEARFEALFGDIPTVRYYLVLGGIAQVEAARDEIVGLVETPAARVELAVRRFLDFVEARPTLYKAFRRTNDEPGPIGELSRRGLARILAELGPDISDLQGRSDASELIAEALLPQIFPAVDHWFDNRDRIERAEVEGFILTSLGAAREPSREP